MDDQMLRKKENIMFREQGKCYGMDIVRYNELDNGETLLLGT